MPIINVTGPPLTVEQKRELVKGLTEAACRVYPRPPELIVVIIRENQPENVAIGGELVLDRHARERVTDDAEPLSSQRHAEQRK